MTFLEYQRRKDRRHDATAWACPKCGFETKDENGRKCPNPGCDHVGDWIQPGEYLTYDEKENTFLDA